MTTDEKNAKIQTLENEFERAKRAIQVQWLKDNNPYKIGDIITNDVDKIKIDKIVFRDSGLRFSGFAVNAKGAILKTYKDIYYKVV